MGILRTLDCLLVAIILQNLTPALGLDDCTPAQIPGKTMYIVRNYETENCLGTTTTSSNGNESQNETPLTILTMKICDLSNANLHFNFEPQNKIKHYESGLCLTATLNEHGTEVAIIGSRVLLLPCDTTENFLAGSQTWFDHNRYNSFTAMWTTWKAESGELRLTANTTSVPYTPFMSSYDYWEGKQLWIFEGVPSCENGSPGNIP